MKDVGAGFVEGLEARMSFDHPVVQLRVDESVPLEDRDELDVGVGSLLAKEERSPLVVLEGLRENRGWLLDLFPARRDVLVVVAYVVRVWAVDLFSRPPEVLATVGVQEVGQLGEEDGKEFVRDVRHGELPDDTCERLGPVREEGSGVWEARLEVFCDCPRVHDGLSIVLNRGEGVLRSRGTGCRLDALALEQAVRAFVRVCVWERGRYASSASVCELKKMYLLAIHGAMSG